MSEPDYKLFSTRAVTAGTFLGGPLATGILMRRNFLNLGDRSKASRALWMSVVFTVALFAALCLIPEKVSAALPGSAFTAGYTALAYQLMLAYQGKALTSHRNAGGLFYSGWKTFGVGMGALLATVLTVFSVVFTLSSAGLISDVYGAGLDKFEQHEQRALKLYELAGKDETTDTEMAQFIQQTGLPAWQECERALAEIEQNASMTDDQKQEIQRLQNYVRVRVEMYETMLKIARGEGNLDELNKTLDQQLEKLQSYM